MLQKAKTYLGWVLAALVIAAVVVALASCKSSRAERQLAERERAAEQRTAVLCKALEQTDILGHAREYLIYVVCLKLVCFHKRALNGLVHRFAGDLFDSPLLFGACLAHYGVEPFYLVIRHQHEYADKSKQKYQHKI